MPPIVRIAGKVFAMTAPLVAIGWGVYELYGPPWAALSVGGLVWAELTLTGILDAWVRARR